MVTLTDVAKEVRAAFEIDPRVDLHRFPIQVVHNGEGVRLEGDVESIKAKRVALQLAQRVSGMAQVIDALRLVPTEPRSDGEIRDAFGRSLLAQPELRNCTLRLHNKGQLETLHQSVDADPSGAVDYAVSNGVVTIDGNVISLSHKRVVEALAWWSPGCRNVVNRLNVVPDEEDNDDEINDAVRLVLEIDPLVHADQIGVRTERAAVTLTGLLHRDEERRMAEMDAWAVCGVTEVHNQIELMS